MLNEAELESALSQVLKGVFPTFSEVGIKHQRSFSIKFGHRMVTVDLKDPSIYPSRAIFDILLTIDEKPMILLELKKEGLELTDKDLSQGLSYARLIDPMPPLTVLSNGHKNVVYNTYTKGMIDTDIIDLHLLQSIIDNSFAIALNDFQEAVRTLLNKDYSFFSNVINSNSRERFRKKAGSIEQFDKVICDEFQIYREIQKNIEKVFFDENTHVGVVGPAFSGKTDLLYQFYKSIDSSKGFTFYIDCNDFNVSILQQLATDISSNSKIFISKDKIREFFSNSLTDDIKFYLLVDNFNSTVAATVMEDILELMQMFKTSNHKVLFTIDEYNMEKLVTARDRNYLTTIGEMSTILTLQDLDRTEYEEASEIMLTNHQVFIAQGGHMATEYRQPRILRHLLAANKHDRQTDRAISIDAVPNQEVLELICNNPAYPRQLHIFYKNLSKCFIREFYQRKKSSELATMALLSGAVTVKSYEALYKKETKKIIRSGFVVIRYLSNGTPVIYPKVPELVAYHSIDPLLQILLIMSKNKSVKDIVSKFIDLLTSFPCPDIIGSAVLLKLIEQGHVDLFLNMTKELLDMPPDVQVVDGEMTALAYFEDVGHIKITTTVKVSGDLENSEWNIEDPTSSSNDSDSVKSIGNYLPYPILSQLAKRIFLVGNDEISERSLNSHRFLIWKIGSQPHIILRVDGQSIRNLQNISTHDIEGGEVVCHREGIVETIVQSIQTCFISLPQHIEQIFEDAKSDKNRFLLWRIFQALVPLTNSVNVELSERASVLISEFLTTDGEWPIC